MKKNSFLIVVLSLALFACHSDKLKVDVSDVKTEPLKLLRLEDDVFSLSESNVDAASVGLKKKYGNYYDHYLAFLNLSGLEDPAYKSSIIAFNHDNDVKGAYREVKALYPDSKLNEMMPQINDCVKRFHYHFPKRHLPARVITNTNGWNYSFAYMDSALIIGLDMYLSDTSMYYSMLRYPQYQTHKMNSAYILPDVARGWLLTEFDNNEAQSVLLNHTIFYGKLFYAVNALLPETHDSLLIGYTLKQLQYCKEYEKKLWGYFAEKNRLYENNMQTIRELTSEGPFTGAISKDCPPRIAMWIGWQIVRSYMKNNEKVSLDELMNEKDAQKILNKSRYRP